MSRYAGSHPTIQCVVGRLNRSVQIADERMGFVQAQRIEGVWRLGGRASLYAPAGAPAIRARRRTRNATPCPPTTHLSGWGPPQNFPHFFLIDDNQPKGVFVNGY